MDDIGLTFDNIKKNISDTRLGIYKKYFGCKNDAELLGVYAWNKLICAEFMPIIQSSEIIFRNSIDTNATQHFNNKWWFIDIVERAAKGKDQNYSSKNQIMSRLKKELIEHEVQDRKIRGTRKEIGKNINKKNWHQLQEMASEKLHRNPHRILMKMTFGFWSSLLHKNYIDKNLLWHSLTRNVFPYADLNEKNVITLNASLKEIRELFLEINRFRNRVAHHEPIWHRNRMESITVGIDNLKNTYNSLLKSIEIIDPGKIEFLNPIDKFLEICSIDYINTMKDTYVKYSSNFSDCAPVYLKNS